MDFLCFLGFNGFCGGRWFCFQFFVLQWIVAATIVVVVVVVAATAVLWLLFIVLDILFYCIVYRLKNIKNRFHDTINIFKNYFTTVFLVFNFQFQQQ